MKARTWLFVCTLAWTAALGILTTTGCGPTLYVNRVTRKASASIEAAKAVNADQYAPYEYTLAVEYLHKAREEAAHADYQAANRFGERSHKAAEKARKLAIQRAANPKDTSWKRPEPGKRSEPEPEPDNEAAGQEPGQPGGTSQGQGSGEASGEEGGKDDAADTSQKPDQADKPAGDASKAGTTRKGKQ